MDKADLHLRLRVIGPPLVGKTYMITKYADNFHYFGNKRLKFGSMIMKLEIEDVSNQERFLAFDSTARGILLLFDVSNRESFEDIDKWMKDIKKRLKSPLTVPILLVGNKVDLIDERVVSTEEGKEKANKLGVSYIETSAEADFNVDETFLRLVEEIVKIDKEMSLDGFLAKQ